MRHPHDEVLAGLALDEPDRLSRSQRLHLRFCGHCSSRLRELRTLVATGRAGEPEPLRAPRPGLLAAIQAELATDPAPAPTPMSGPGRQPEQPLLADRPVPVPARARSYVPRLIGAAAVLAVAVGGTVWYRSGDDVVAQAALAPLPDKTGRGTARLTSRDGALQLSIDVTSPATPNAFEELWLLNTDGRKMISLGVVPPDGRATYPVPTAKGALDGYIVVDISIEPFDGNSDHSHNSLLRGTLG
ncbi:anti-sigma factor domain-containing protein [uncultured Friedmanniella sp.]|uniref:anti-sigma factor domain-containing protein n=1 Tax=uncultured Friedmanniella sp. TaxID=335381 RepID=UPI0035CAE956